MRSWNGFKRFGVVLPKGTGMPGATTYCWQNRPWYAPPLFRRLCQPVMRLQPSETTLVVAGAWNPAILSPEWVMRHALQVSPGEIRINAQVPATLGMAVEFPRFTFEGLTYSARPDAFVLAPQDTEEASFQKLERVAGNTLTELPHTPVSGFGHNFEFHDEAPQAGQLEPFSSANLSLIDHVPDGWTMERTALAASFRTGPTLVNVVRQYTGTKLVVKFNFHHEVNSSEQCIRLLSGSDEAKSMFQNYQIARQLITEVFGGIEDENQP